MKAHYPSVRPNPKYKLASNFDELLRIFTRGEKSYRLALDWETGKGQSVWPFPRKSGAGKGLAVVDVESEAIVLERKLMHPTTVHWLYEFLSAHGQDLLEYRLLERDPDPPNWKNPYIDTGYTVRRFLDEAKIVSEESVVRHGRDASRSQKKVFEYRALKTAKEMVWYHATLARNIPSIMERGLLPSSLEKGRPEGWSPGWNMDLQRAVYLASNESFAIRIAETLAYREEQDVAVVEVDGRGLEDTKRLTFDEDALRNKYDDSVGWESYDADFPQWVSGLESHVESIAYIGKISPKYLRVPLIGTYKVEAYAKPYSKPDADPETDPDEFRFESEVEWSETK